MSSFELGGPHTADRCALVTGASRGIGLEVATRLAKEGFRLTVSAGHAPDLESVAGRLVEQTGAEINPVIANLGRENDVLALAAAHADRFGRLDLLVMAAGMGNVAQLTEASTRDGWSTGATTACDLLGTACLPMLRSTAALDPRRGSRMVLVAPADEALQQVYGAHKDAMVSLCDQVNLTESASGVTATTISPGHIDHNMTMWRRGYVNPDEMVISADLADVILALTTLTANAVVPNIVLARKGQPA
ncbi:MAG TPA: SDR family oxidoreductase [Pseudonocardiaceae bacterium]|nr:SDR family oxidoreductase [Pseudonocardiaceae bacterium]